MENPNLNLTYPRYMMVSDKPITKENPGNKKIVFYYNPKLLYAYFTYNSALKDYNSLSNTPDGREVVGWVGWTYAKDYVEPQIELTLQEIADKFNVDVKNLKI